MWEQYVGKTFETYSLDQPDKVIDTFVFQKDFDDHYSIVGANAARDYYEAQGDRLVNERLKNIVIKQNRGGGFDWSTGYQSRIRPPAFVQTKTGGNETTTADAGDWTQFSGEQLSLMSEHNDRIDKVLFEKVDSDLFIGKGFYSGTQVYKLDQGGSRLINQDDKSLSLRIASSFKIEFSNGLWLKLEA